MWVSRKSFLKGRGQGGGITNNIYECNEYILSTSLRYTPGTNHERLNHKA